MAREGYRRDADPDDESDIDRRRRRRERKSKHTSADSTTELLPAATKRREGYYRESPNTTPRRDADRDRRREERRRERREREELVEVQVFEQEKRPRQQYGRSDKDHERRRRERRRRREEERRRQEELEDEEDEDRRRRHERRRRRREERARADDGRRDEHRSHRHREVDEGSRYAHDQRNYKNRRVVSGQTLELADDTRSNTSVGWWRLGLRGGGLSESSYMDEKEELMRKKRRRKRWIIAAVALAVILIVIPVAVVVARKDSNAAPAQSSSASNGTPGNSNLDGLDPNSVPAAYKGTWMDPWSWYDTEDFNVTFTDTMVGGLPIIGLNDTWDDSAQANPNVPALDQPWNYGTMPVRGINVGGWLVLEPMITPSFFNQFKSSQGVVDEWTLSQTLGNGSAKSTIEPHYSSFLTEEDFVNIQAAGFDHVRIPFGYWAIISYDDDPFITQVAWRYLLRAIEWARKYGLRINLDLHGAPGSQNGWNHSGRQGAIGWLNGTDGELNANRTLQIHDQLSAFFAQPRYKNIIAFYGLLNEPRMTSLPIPEVLDWTASAATLVRNNGINATIVFGDGFMGLDNWQGKLQDIPGLLLDVHQYVIFNTQQLSLAHADKVTFACGGWTAQAKSSMSKSTGFGPTIFAEWSQADTDCATYLNNVGVGSRWQGTLNMLDTPGGGSNQSVLEPTCPTQNNPQCVCAPANADPSTYSAEYKAWLLQFALAQMDSFEYGWGWFYWTWKTESAVQWSYKDGMAAGILPQKTWERSWNCSMAVPDYAGAGLAENY